VDARRLVLGDWTPVVRDGIDVLRLVILGGALAYAVAGRPGAASLLAALGAVTVVARVVNLPPRVRPVPDRRDGPAGLR
jgi:hypothetical protein